jgi:DNA topoisomerase-1
MIGAVLFEVRERVESELREDLHALRPEEAAVLSLLKSRITEGSGPLHPN